MALDKFKNFYKNSLRILFFYYKKLYYITKDIKEL